MTLQEAVKSGKAFRHKKWDFGGWLKDCHKHETVTIAQAISDDWEIQQKESFTRGELGCRHK